jgi:N-acetyl-anhydromuramyl-L-alanine amidase AmpD
MARPLNDSPYLYGFHDPGGESTMTAAGVLGWVLFTEELGHDPANQSGHDYSGLANQGLGILARLNNGYYPDGTIPSSNQYGQFAQRCANFVTHSPGCHIWIIGNEMNYPVERPGVQYDFSRQPPVMIAPGEVITPELYASCYRQCRAAIRALPGHGDDQVIVGATAPWNNQTSYATNPTGDWVVYHADVLNALGGPANCDGVSIHTYTHGTNPSLIYTDTLMQPPFQNRQYNFRAYQDFMRAIPASMRGLPVYITEADENDPWLDQNNAWVQRAYGEINAWNQGAGNQNIRALLLYRWQPYDKWGIQGKNGVITDFRAALAQKYVWASTTVQVYGAQYVLSNTPAQFTVGSTALVTLTLRNTGTRPWAATGATPVQIGYHWLDSAGRLVTLPASSDIRSPLPRAINPGEQVQATARLAGPPTAGAYTLQWDLVEGNSGWFSQMGITPLAVAVALQAAQPQPEQPITFPETGHTARGTFAAFYRQYGLDVTGYPLTEEYIASNSGLKTQDWQRVIMEEFPAGKVRLRLVGSQLAALQANVTQLQINNTLLQATIAQLQAEVARLKKGSGGTSIPTLPNITDITQQLPRDPAGFVPRPLSDIRYIVINHTAVRPDVGADRVAQAQRTRWPGIVGQYFITGDGQIQQTEPLDQAVNKDQPWVYNGVNIYVAGNFDATTPSEAQMAALTSLTAWLLGQFKLDASAVRGASEFVATHSPGDQWLKGARWRDALLAGLAAVPVEPGQQTGGDTAALQAQIAALQARLTDLTGQISTLTARNAELQTQLDALQQSARQTPLQAPPVTDMIAQMPRNPGSLKARTADQIKYIVLNHTAVDASVSVERVAAAHQTRWGSILFQYFINADGTILQTNALDQVVDLSQPWIGQGVNIALAGNFTTDIPTDAQLDATARLAAWLMQQYNIPTDNVKGVSEFIVTQSPGLQWLQGKVYKNLLLAHIADVQKSAGPGQGDSSNAAEVAQLRGQITQLQTTVSQITAERDQARGQVTPLTQQVQTLNAQIAPLTQQVQTLTQQAQALTSDKAALTAQVHTLTGQVAPLTQQVQTLNGQVQTLTTDRDRLNAQVAPLTQQVQALTNDKAALNQQLAGANQDLTGLNQRISDLQARLAQLQAGGNTSGNGNTGGTNPAPLAPPQITDIEDQLPKHPTLKYDTRTLDKVTHIAIHHSAGPASVTPQQVAAYHVSKDWPGIGYHFYVEPDGTIYQTNRLETVAYNVYNNNHYLIGICTAGTFNDVTPTPLQIERLAALVAWLRQKLNIPINNVCGHREFPDNATECPGNEWLGDKRWKDMLLARVRAAEVAGAAAAAPRAIGHYMLFWQHPDDWAKDDWLGAVNYIARFRPTAGFSADDAKTAEYVTIVGGPNGVSIDTEMALVAAGCKVERLAGADFNATKQMLDDMAASGKRFRTFNV